MVDLRSVASISFRKLRLLDKMRFNLSFAYIISCSSVFTIKPFSFYFSLNVLISLLSGKSFPFCLDHCCFFLFCQGLMNMEKKKIFKSLFKSSGVLWIVLSLICIQMNIAALAVSAVLQSGCRAEL